MVLTTWRGVPSAPWITKTAAPARILRHRIGEIDGV
jgi:hypothetical protein